MTAVGPKMDGDQEKRADMWRKMNMALFYFLPYLKEK